MLRRLYLLVVCLLFSAPSLAQTVPASQPFQVAFDDNQTVLGYRCYVDGVKVAEPTAKVCNIPGQAAGNHVIEVSAVNAIGEGAKSAGLVVTAGSAPVAPTNLRIVVQIAVQPSGAVTLLAASVAAVP
jgi:predicted phage tail protein